MRRARRNGDREEVPSTVDSALKKLSKRKDAWVSLSHSKKLHLLSSVGSNFRKIDLDTWSREDAKIEGYDVSTIAGDTQAAKNSLRDTVTMLNVVRTLKRTLKGKAKGDDRMDLPVAPGGNLQHFVTFPTNASEKLSTVGMMGLSGQVWCRQRKDPTIDVDAAIASRKSRPSSPRALAFKRRFSIRSSSPMSRGSRVESVGSDVGPPPGQVAVILAAHWAADLFAEILWKLFNQDSVVLVQIDRMRSASAKYFENLFGNFIELGFVVFLQTSVNPCAVPEGLLASALVDSVHISGNGSEAKYVERTLLGPSEEPQPEPEEPRKGRSKESKEGGRRRRDRRHEKRQTGTSKRRKKSSKDAGKLYSEFGKLVTSGDGGASPWVIVSGGAISQADAASVASRSRSGSSASESSASSSEGEAGCWTREELEHHARLLLAAATSSGACTSHTPRAVVLDSDWPHTEEFIALLSQIAKEMTPQPVHHPMARANCASVTRALEKAAKKSKGWLRLERRAYVSPPGGGLPVMTPLLAVARLEETKAGKLDSKVASLLGAQPGFPLLVVCTVEGDNSPADFLAQASRLMHKYLPGNLACSVVVHPQVEASDVREVEEFLEELQYGVVCVNQWAAFARMVPGVAWGAHAKARHEEVAGAWQRWTKNEYMLTHIDKSVVRSPFLHPAQPLVQGGADTAGPRSSAASDMEARRARLTRGFLMKPTVTGMLRMMMAPAPRSSSVGAYEKSRRDTRDGRMSSFSSLSSGSSRDLRSSSR